MMSSPSSQPTTLLRFDMEAPCLIVLYITGYWVCMFATNTPLTNLNARLLGTERTTPCGARSNASCTTPA